MKIKYKINNKKQLFTECPNGNDGVKAGSIACGCCNYFVSDDAEKKIVECSFKINKKVVY